jgi:DNA-binding SARP family transcriptional activator
MTAESCNKVLRRKDSAGILNLLVRKGLFITSTGERPKTFEYHPQFREFLVAVARRESPEHLHRQLLRAARCLRDVGSIEDSVKLLMDLGEMNAALKIAEANCRDLQRSGRVETLVSWTKAFARFGMNSRTLAVRTAQCYINNGSTTVARAYLEPFHDRPILQPIDAIGTMYLAAAMVDEDDAGARRVLRNVMNSKAFRRDTAIRAETLRYYGMLVAFSGGRAALAAQAMAESVRLQRRRKDFYQLANCLLAKFIVEEWLGWPVRAKASLEAAIAWADRVDSPVLAALTKQRRAWLALLDGNFETADRLLAEGEEAAANLAMTSQAVLACCYRVGLASLAGEFTAGASLLGKMESLEASDPGGRTWGRSLVFTSRLQLLRRGSRSGEAARVARDVLATPAAWYPRSFTTLEAILTLAHDSPKEAREELRKFVRVTRRRLGAPEHVYGYLIRARVAMSLADHRLALEELSKAIDFSGERGGVDVLVDDIVSDRDLARLAAQIPQSSENRRGFLKRVARLESWIAGRKAQKVRSNPLALKATALGVPKLIASSDNPARLRPLDREIAFMIIDRREVPREEVYESFWPSKELSSQAVNLHSATYRIRKALGCRLVELESNYCKVVDGPQLWYDVRDFETLAARFLKSRGGPNPSLVELGQETLGLYRGPFMEGHSSEWVLRRRRELEVAVVMLSLKVTRAAIDLEMYDSASLALAAGGLADPDSEVIRQLKAVNLYLQGFKEPAISEMQAYIADEEQTSDALRGGSSRAIEAAMFAGENPWPMAKKLLAT